MRGGMPDWEPEDDDDEVIEPLDYTGDYPLDGDDGDEDEDDE
jgi:hypothetical protein